MTLSWTRLEIGPREVDTLYFHFYIYPNMYLYLYLYMYLYCAHVLFMIYHLAFIDTGVPILGVFDLKWQS